MKWCAVCVMLFLATGPVLAADEPNARVLYDGLCAACHGPGGHGDGDGVADAYLRPRDFARGEFKFDTDADWVRGSDADLADVIRNGAGAYGGSALMPPWPQLSDAQIAELIALIRSLAR